MTHAIDSEGYDLMDYIITLASTAVISTLEDYRMVNALQQFSNILYAKKYNSILNLVQTVKTHPCYNVCYKSFKTNLWGHLTVESSCYKFDSTMFLWYFISLLINLLCGYHCDDLVWYLRNIMLFVTLFVNLVDLCNFDMFYHTELGY